jgi:hydroxymethylbilane synthase
MKPLIIGTRDSELALWQAKKVQRELKSYGVESVLHPVKSAGDLNLNVPLYEMGITGIFTKSLDIALLNGEIDLAVHSMKDVPTQLPKTVIQAAVLPRANYHDILVYKNLEFLSKEKGHIATGSLRRKAQWLHKYPNHSISDLRGNVNTRLQKLQDNPWDGAIFAMAGLERIEVLPVQHITLDWMVPAPAQGAMLVVTTETNKNVIEALAPLNDKNTEICTHIERQFLRTLEGGCTAPIGALAQVKKDTISFKGVLLNLDGTQRFEVETQIAIKEYKDFGKACADDILKQGGDQVIEELRKIL